ncbi:MAG: hypothetical protein KJ914_11015 [Gammaproteobacteria bacterium]|nr:hypothetical protein [Gammaproteobacteria bacterium]MBU1722418.1 hypothetical protein [Gammaproteobacteria bacterium]MBU2004645.1 hypothetical protein [Gammaproteobacteria bacterium]
MAKLATNILATLSLLSVAACANTSGPAAGTAFVTDTSAASVAFRSLRVESGSSGQASLVKGQLHRTGHEPVRFGHVDYVVRDAQGNVREEGWVEHSAAIRLRHAHRPSLFSINLKQPVTQGDQIQLTYHTSSHS